MGAPPVDRELTPPAFLQLAGHPLRWSLVRELAVSDRTVQELTERVRQPQNLVSYHLAKLRAARLVSARRSSADGRDAYYRVDLTRFGDLLTATGTALHPGLHPDLSSGSRAEPSPPGAGVPAAERPRVLFLCTGNSARSQMAEALAHDRSGGRVEAYSAGSSPKPLHPNAVRAMGEVHGIDLSGRRPKHLEEFAGTRFDRVVTLCDRLREVCPEFPGRPITAHWSMADPAATHPDDDEASYPAFQQTAHDLDARIGYLLAAVAAPTHPE